LRQLLTGAGNSAFIFLAMLTGEEQNKEENNGQPLSKLETEGPLKEIDQQGQAMERARKLGEEALKQWRRSKKSIKDQFKK
jgi:hypothetical protein